jgi:hypothetical protein
MIYLRYKHQHTFKIIIEKGLVIKNEGNIAAEFLYDIQQLSRINQPDGLIIKGSQLLSNNPIIKFEGVLSSELQQKIEHSLILSLS